MPRRRGRVDSMVGVRLAVTWKFVPVQVQPGIIGRVVVFGVVVVASFCMGIRTTQRGRAPRSFDGLK